MTIWLDAQLPPLLAPWIAQTYNVAAVAVRELGLREAKDPQIFQAARAEGAVVMTKDADFVELVTRLGAPPQILWVRCGNTTNIRLRGILGKCMPLALEMLQKGEPIIEIDESV